MKRYLVFCLILTAQALGAQSRYTLLESHFVPATYYVGDTVELRLTFHPGEAQDIYVSSEATVLQWVEIRDIKLIPQLPNYELVVTFVPYVTGSWTLPVINLGSIQLEGLRIYTSSLLTGQELAPPMEQLLLPMTELVITIALGLFILIPLVVWKTHKRVQLLYARLARAYNRHRPYKRLSKELNKLKLQVFSLDPPEFYRRLQTSVREYLSVKWGKDLLSYTTRELKEEFSRHLDTDSHRILSDFFRYSDVVIFDRRKVEDHRAVDDLELVGRIALKLEEVVNVEL